MEVLITSKTHKGKAACVGGLVLEDNKFVRLLRPGNWDQLANTDFKIGEVWDIYFEKRYRTEPPHIEDVIVYTKKRVGKVDNFTDFILSAGINIYRGEPENIFDGLLKWTFHGSGFLNRSGELPSNSVGFWIPDKNLSLNNHHYLYQYQDFIKHTKRLPYVGFEEAVEVIPAGTLVRISLARWWKPEDAGDEMEERCYLQLSGWYEIS